MIQAMAASRAGGGGADGNSGSGRHGQVQSLGRQGSMCSLTLDEVQHQLGEPLLSMNLDELLKSVFPDGLEPDGGTASQSEPASTSGLQRQGSITMPPELSKKTVDEVWKGILDSPKRNAQESGWRRQERQPTLGEMTLEDFLAKAGIVVEGCLKDSNDLPANMDAVGSSVLVSNLNPGAQWLHQYQQQALKPQHPSMSGSSYMSSQLGPQQLGVRTCTILEPIYSDGHISSPMLGTLSDPQTPGRKQGVSGGVPDKVVERRQKRMIKNRESAARSRARKQAYTNELENKISRLEEENERLKRHKELDQILVVAPPQEPKYQLGRTNSCPA